jgi:glucans biosynthesis protein
MAAPQGRGPPLGNQNALKNGLYTREAIAQRRAIRELLREVNQMLERFEKG